MRQSNKYAMPFRAFYPPAAADLPLIRVIVATTAILAILVGRHFRW